MKLSQFFSRVLFYWADVLKHLNCNFKISSKNIKAALFKLQLLRGGFNNHDFIQVGLIIEWERVPTDVFIPIQVSMVLFQSFVSVGLTINNGNIFYFTAVFLQQLFRNLTEFQKPIRSSESIRNISAFQ